MSSGVKRVYGTADGTDILFIYDEESGRWETTVPRDKDGRYVVSLWAEDFAGNKSYYATILFTVDTKSMCIKVEWVTFNAQAKKDKYHAQTKYMEYTAHVIQCEKCRC